LKHKCVFLLTCHVFQLKDLAERLPPDVYDADKIKPAYLPNGFVEPNGIRHPDSNGEHHHTRAESISGSSVASIGLESSLMNRIDGNSPGSYATYFYQQNRGSVTTNGTDDHRDVKLPNGGGAIQATNNSASDTVDGRDSGNFRDDESGSRSRNDVLPANANSNQVEAEWIEQYEPGVYITLVAMSDGTRDLRRVRFR
jgi:hypothetical protein